MTQIMDGKKVAALLKEELHKEITDLKEKGIVPKLAVLLAGEDPASVAYAKFLEKVSNNYGVSFELHSMEQGASEIDIKLKIEDLNCDSMVHGILIMMPLPAHISKKRVMEAVNPLKDVDGLHPYNRGHLISGGMCIQPATPLSCLEIMRRSGVSIAGKHMVIVGRGETVGKPLVFMALAENATVSVCHTKTTDLASFTRQADIIVCAVGLPGLIKADMVKPGAVVVDAGISEVDGQITGDVDFDQVKEVAGAITPVPGGVGSLTTVLMLKNLVKGIHLQEEARRWEEV